MISLKRRILNELSLRRTSTFRNDRVILQNAVSSSYMVNLRDKSAPFISATISGLTAGDQNNINGTNTMSHASVSQRYFAIKALDNTRGIALFIDGSDSNYPKVVAFSWDGTTFTIGDAVRCETANDWSIPYACSLSVLSSSQAIPCFITSEGFSWSRVFAANISGTEITMGGGTANLTPYTHKVQATCKMNSTDTIWFTGLTPYGSSEDLDCSIIRRGAGGTSFSAPSNVLAVSGPFGGFDYSPDCINITENQVLLVYFTYGQIIGRIINWDGTSVLSLGDYITISEASYIGENYHTALNLYDTGKVALMYFNQNTNTTRLQLISIDGSTPSLEGEVQIDNIVNGRVFHGMDSMSTTKLIGAYNDSNNKLHAFMATDTDGTPAVNYTAIGNSNTVIQGCDAISLSGDLVAMYQDDATGDKGEIQIFTVDTTAASGSRIKIQNVKSGRRTAKWVA